MILFRERKLERIMNRMTVRIAKDEVKKKEIQKEKEQKEKEQKEKKQKEKEQKEEQERVIKIIGYEKIAEQEERVEQEKLAEQEESIKQEKAADQIIEMSSSEEPKVGWQDLFAMFLAAGITFLPVIIIFLLVISAVFLVFLP